ncbi:MAG TPA: apolipoprotein N-acyltransferase [Rhodobacteraceae bacterium]|nr:apolipoprotein N-acyltransferase [Paracoccaceae bacterium]
MPADHTPGGAGGPAARARLPDWVERRPGRALAAGGLAGLIAGFGQAPFNLWPATLAGLALAFALLGAAPSLKRAALTGWAVGLGYFGLTLVWIVQPFLVDVAKHGWMAPFAWFFMAGGMALFWGAGFGAAQWLAPPGPRRDRFGWLAFAAALGAMELARAQLWTGFPWGGPGLSWVGTPVAGLATIFGAFGLSVASFAGGALIARLHGIWGGGRCAAAVAAGAAGLALTFGLGWLAGQGDIAEDEEPVRLRLVQPNAPQHLKWDPDWIGTFYDRSLALTRTAPEGAPPELVIWPETAVPTLLGEYPRLQAEIAEAAAPARAIAGIRRLDGARGYNSLVLFGPDGAPEALYDKHHIVPFGEYTPLGDLLGRFGINGLAARDGYGYSRGPGAQLLELPDALGTALPLICYEAIFARDLRAAPGRADWILQLTNDAWFGAFSGPYQHLVQARFRAIEFGLPVVRAANTGVSAVIDARGRVTAGLPLNTAGHLDADLPGARAPTIYARLGDLPLTLAIFAALAGLAAMRPRETG